MSVDGSGTGDSEPDDGAAPELPDAFEGLVLDENFVRGGAYEPPARTREAIARHGNDKTSWRHGGGLNQSPAPTKRPRKADAAARPASKRRERLIAWLPAIVAVLAVALVVAFGSHLSL